MKIKDIYNIEFDLNTIPEDELCSMHIWYKNLINKTYTQLDLFDVTRMLIQNMFLDIAVKKAIEYLKINPFCGQRYEGELIELILKIDSSYLESHKEEIKIILNDATNKNVNYEWLVEEERQEFSDLLNILGTKLDSL